MPFAVEVRIVAMAMRGSVARVPWAARLMGPAADVARGAPGVAPTGALHRELVEVQA